MYNGYYQLTNNHYCKARRLTKSLTKSPKVISGVVPIPTEPVELIRIASVVPSIEMIYWLRL